MTVLGDYTDKNILSGKLPGGSTNYTAEDVDWSGFVNDTVLLADLIAAMPPIITLQAFITDNLYAEQLRELTAIIQVIARLLIRQAPHRIKSPTSVRVCL